MRILVTGTEGYIGTLLAPILMERGHDVLGLDTGFYKVGWLYHGTPSTARTLNKDIRHITNGDLRGIEAVVHLAELSNDPLGQLAPDVTFDINYKGSIRLANLAKEAGVRRFVYTSSCSIYGIATADCVTEESSPNPQTPYAMCKMRVERDVGGMADEDFSPVFLRNATAFGASPRMRFDIVLNNLSGVAWVSKEVKMESDGTPWRPLVHVLDICKAIACTLDAPRHRVHNQVFNVGDSTSNYQVRDIAAMVADVLNVHQVSFASSNGADNRSYRVSFEKISRVLPEFSCDWQAQDGVQQLADLFAQIDLSEETFLFRGFTRLKQLAHLIRTGQIDEQFFWKAPFGLAVTSPRVAAAAV